MATPSPKEATFWQETDLEKELQRVYEVCDTCRRCYNLCPSFKILLNGIDDVDGEVDQLSPSVTRDVVDYCFQCKLCYPHCPYTPPHRWAIDFPRLMLRARAVRHRREGIPLEDRILGSTDLIGRWGSMFAPVSNFGNRNRLKRKLISATVGIAERRILPEFSRKTFQKCCASFHPETAPKEVIDHVVLFHTCYINYQDVDLGKDILAFLDRQRIAVTIPDQLCCGMPHLDGGDVQRTVALAKKNLARLLPLARAGLKIISPGPTCSYMLRNEYPYLLNHSEESETVAAAVMDLMEYLNDLHQRKVWTPTWPDRFDQKVFYHIPCHLKAQNVGFHVTTLLQKIPGLKLEVAERCTGMDGTWGMKKRFYEASLEIAQPLIDQIERFGPDWILTDCPLAALQIRQMTGKRPKHPIQFLKSIL